MSPEKSRYLILGFQTDRSGKEVKNMSVFDHCNLINAYVLLNNVRYPAMDFNENFAKKISMKVFIQSFMISFKIITGLIVR